MTGRCDHGCEAQWTGDFCERKNTTRYTNKGTVENILKLYNQKPMHLFQNKKEHDIMNKLLFCKKKKNEKNKTKQKQTQKQTKNKNIMKQIVQHIIYFKIITLETIVLDN